MPSFRVEGTSVSLIRFDVVGKDGDQPRFISHTGLAESDESYATDAVAIFDLGPPLHGPGQAIKIHANAIGRAELNDDEVQKIRTFVAQHTSEHSALLQLSVREVLRCAPQMYCIFPHATPFAEDDGRYVRMRFSCAGFAFEAYKFARIALLNPSEVPQVDMAVIRTAYPSQTRLFEDGKITLDSMGLNGSGPWRVLLCGYLFHALDRPKYEIRDRLYSPTEEDRYFPRYS